jgi:N-acetylneuraminate synthase
MRNKVKIGNYLVGDGEPCFIIAEIGINHNGDVKIAKKLIDAAAVAGCNAVKFQKRTPELCVPPHQRDMLRETPWGVMSYMDYRRKVEFGFEEYEEIDHYCEEKDILWFASCWDEPSVDFMEQFNPPCYKIPSACVTDIPLIRRINATGRPILLSTGMSTLEQIREATDALHADRTILMHCTSSYPCPVSELNLKMIDSLRQLYDCPIGYSGHEVGLQTSYAAVALGACALERHITLDRAMWGSDHAASVEGIGLMRLARDIRIIETALGDGVKRIYESELHIMKRLRLRSAEKV